MGRAAMVELLHNRRDFSYNKTITLHRKEDRILKSLPSLKSIITPKQKKQIIKKIFNNDEKEFNNLIEELESVTNWADALTKIETEFSKRDIYLHGPHAVLFTDILYARYFSQDDQIQNK